MHSRNRSSTASEILDSFAADTGISSDEPPRRYLWTDAYAVCTWLGLHRRMGEERYLERARALVEQVHRVLGRHRPDDPRSGWISGLDEEEGAHHPTAGGLRIGKDLPEREPDEPMDPRLEWDRDGQYFHYLTRWMHALLRMWEETGERRYLRQGLELARAAFDGFVMVEGGGADGAGRAAPVAEVATAEGATSSTRVRMIWKASVDLSRALVDSQGHHDPLDGWITFRTLQAAREEARSRPAEAAADPGLPLPGLQEELDVLEPLLRQGRWVTNDALGIGGLLADVRRVLRLEEAGSATLPGLSHRLCRDGVRSLEALERQEPFRLPAEHRLPFRELGLSLGLRGVERVGSAGAEFAAPEAQSGAPDVRDPGSPPPGEPLPDCLATLAQRSPLAHRIEVFWLEPEHRAASTWTEHLDINRVALAASLVPEGWFR